MGLWNDVRAGKGRQEALSTVPAEYGIGRGQVAAIEAGGRVVTMGDVGAGPEVSLEC